MLTLHPILQHLKHLMFQLGIIHWSYNPKTHWSILLKDCQFTAEFPCFGGNVRSRLIDF